MRLVFNLFSMYGLGLLFVIVTAVYEVIRMKWIVNLRGGTRTGVGLTAMRVDLPVTDYLIRGTS